MNVKCKDGVLRSFDDRGYFVRCKICGVTVTLGIMKDIRSKCRNHICAQHTVSLKEIVDEYNKMKGEADSGSTKRRDDRDEQRKSEN